MKKYTLTGLTSLALMLSKTSSELFENHKLDKSKPLYYTTRDNHTSYYSAFDLELNRYIFFKDYRCDNILDAVVYQDEEEVDLERDYNDLTKWNKMFSTVLNHVKKGKAIKEKNLSDFLCKHYFNIPTRKKK